MKTIIYIQIICSFLCAGLVTAQPSDRNYIRVITPKESTQLISTLPAGDLLDEINYVDGLGRALQTVQVGYSPNEKDYVQQYEYDRLGRIPKQYYSYATNVSGGSYRTNALSELETFYQNADAVATTSYPWSEKVYDDTPLSRIQELAGNGKEIADNNQQTIRFNVAYNNANEIRYLYTSMSTGDPQCQGHYTQNELVLSSLRNENNQLVELFKNKLGRPVMKREHIGNDTLMTYYVYDDFGKLRFTIPPEGVKELNNSYGTNDWLFSSNFLKTWVYQYQYDERGRLIEKMIPGMEEPIYFIYDQEDKLVLTQDPNFRNENKWSYVKYDILRRPIMIGFYLDLVHTSRSTMQGYVNTFVDNTSTFFHEKNSGLNYASQHGYSNHAFPQQNQEVLHVYYYDDHDFNRDGQQDHSYQADAEFTSNQPFTYTRGIMTGFKVKMLDGSGWNRTVFFMDEFLRVIQVVGENYLGGTDTIHLSYNFPGLFTNTKVIHKKDNNPGSTYTVRSTPVYDHVFRMKQWKHQLNNQSEVILSESAYNEIEQLIENNLHVFNAGASKLQSMDYRYNIHGELTHLNNSNLSNDMGVTNDDMDDLFGMELYYENGFSALNGSNQYNGNISGTTWRAKPDSIKRGYGYQYDELSRLTNASYAAYSENNQSWTDEVNNYSLFDVTYDYHGNIQSLKRRGHFSSGGGGFGMMDQLSYIYTGNKVFTVDDAAAFGETYDFNDNGSKLVSEYAYDDNGNMIHDGNKGLDVTYNYMNLPDTIDFGSGKKIHYLYDASGKKWKKTFKENGIADANLYYHGNFTYNNNGLEFVSTSEGRAVPDTSLGGSFRYEYHFQDHLGNVRLRYSDLDGNGSIDPNQEVIQQAHYYPFGMQMRGLQTAQIGAEHSYKYNNKELQEDHGLHWYDYGLRNYDPQIGRWHSIDPAADYFSSLSPYNYVLNNPIKLVDPDGAFPIDGDPQDPLNPGPLFPYDPPTLPSDPLNPGYTPPTSSTSPSDHLPNMLDQYDLYLNGLYRTENSKDNTDVYIDYNESIPEANSVPIPNFGTTIYSEPIPNANWSYDITQADGMSNIGIHASYNLRVDLSWGKNKNGDLTLVASLSAHSSAGKMKTRILWDFQIILMVGDEVTETVYVRSIQRKNDGPSFYDADRDFIGASLFAIPKEGPISIRIVGGYALEMPWIGSQHSITIDDIRQVNRP